MKTVEISVSRGCSSDYIFIVPKRLSTYLHFFHSLSPFLVILYFLVFSGLMLRFLFLSACNTSLSMFSIIRCPVDAHPMK